jgi:hypothetical protein
MLSIQSLFDKTLDELEQKTKANNEYDILMTTSLLRKLLIDGNNSLVCQINKNGKKLKFTINKRDPLHKRFSSIFNPNDISNYYWFSADGLDPETTDQNHPSYNPQELNFDEFLQYVVIFAKGQEITIRDLIKHLSDKEGGVHKQREKLEKTEVKNILIREIEHTIGIGNFSAGLNTIKAINRIVIRALSVFKS